MSILVLCGVLDMGLGLQATTTGWPDDNGGGPALDASYWFTPHVAATFVGKEQYASVDDRMMSYFSFNASGRAEVGRFRLTGTVGLVHQHEEPRAAIMESPAEALFGVGDGIRHRMGSRAGFSLGLPLSTHGHGDYYVALDLDGTVFMDDDRGPRWMSSAGLSVGFTYDFAHRSAK
ncbi:MAG TPA: hypothetical protein VL326_19165 [Kofleriaceae bacterium]|jgi:hypothetical protein|nr:hypothetical protein [Kofleriaceae bacterium]